MLLTLQDDGVLRVYETAGAAIMDVEALDAETVFREIFDDNAQPYVIEWITPNHVNSSIFGLLEFKLNGEYRLAPKGSRDPAGLLRAIRAANGIDPRKFEPAVRELEIQLATTIGD